jgi:hypothetical protein
MPRPKADASAGGDLKAERSPGSAKVDASAQGSGSVQR